MILIENKRGIIHYNITDRIYLGEDNILKSHNHIWDKQDISIRRLIESDYLIGSIYHEINR
jgi:hypothetical protein